MNLTFSLFIVIQLFLNIFDLLLDLSVSFSNRLCLINKISVFFCRLKLSLPLFSFNNGFELLLCSFYSKLVSESQQFFRVDATEVVNRGFSQHVHFCNFFKLSLLSTKSQIFCWVSNPNVEGVIKATETTLEIQGLLYIGKIWLSRPNTGKRANV